MKAAGISDRGKVREKNEDGYLLFTDGAFRLFAVADGMGGHAAGEVASTLALQMLREYLAEYGGEFLKKPASAGQVMSFVEDMLIFVNGKVLEAGRLDTQRAGMGTTLTLLFGVGEIWCIGHIGDSRAYLINNDGINPLTEDHTLVTQLVRNGQISELESGGHPQRHILTRALGTDEDVLFDIAPQSFWPGDAVLLCTDGLYTLVEDAEIRELVRSADEPRAALERLVLLANERGGTDNITGVLVWF